MKTISLKFKGYWLEINKDSIPKQSGIYCVYTCKYNAEKNTVSIHKLLYIGESKNVNVRIQSHNRLPDWTSKLGYGDELCYSCAPIASEDRERGEAALIFNHQPPMNEEHKNHFVYNDTKIILSGKIKFLHKSFVVSDE